MIRLNFCNMHTYKPVDSNEDEGSLEASLIERSKPDSTESRASRTRQLLFWLSLALAIATGFITGLLMGHGSVSFIQESNKYGNSAFRIPLPLVQREFTYDSPFAKEPPQAAEPGQISEPIWDALIPSEFRSVLHELQFMRCLAP